MEYIIIIYGPYLFPMHLINFCNCNFFRLICYGPKTFAPTHSGPFLGPFVSNTPFVTFIQSNLFRSFFYVRVSARSYSEPLSDPRVYNTYTCVWSFVSYAKTSARCPDPVFTSINKNLIWNQITTKVWLNLWYWLSMFALFVLKGNN